MRHIIGSEASDLIGANTTFLDSGIADWVSTQGAPDCRNEVSNSPTRLPIHYLLPLLQAWLIVKSFYSMTISSIRHT